MSSMLEAAWSALGGDPDALTRVECVPRPEALPARLPVEELAAAAVACVGLAAGDTATVRIDPLRIAVSYTSDRYLRIKGQPVDAWSPLSGFWQTADGWVRTHANYPHHRERLLGALGLPIGAGRSELIGRLADLAAEEVEGGVNADSWGQPLVSAG